MLGRRHNSSPKTRLETRMLTSSTGADDKPYLEAKLPCFVTQLIDLLFRCVQLEERVVDVLGKLSGPYHWCFIPGICFWDTRLGVGDDQDPFFVGVAGRHREKDGAGGSISCMAFLLRTSGMDCTRGQSDILIEADATCFRFGLRVREAIVTTYLDKVSREHVDTL